MRAYRLIASLVILLFVASAFAGKASDAAKAAKDGDWNAAATLYLDAHLEKPEDRGLILKLADAAARTRRRDALDAARDGLFDLTKKNEKDWDAWVALGRVTLERARTMTSGSTIAMEYGDAMDFFGRVIKADPDREGAYTGLAQVHRAQARPDEAMKVLEDYMKRGTKNQADALFWQGQLYYDRAIADFRAKGGIYPLSDAAKQLFRKAQGALEASTMGDAGNYEAWMQLAYASQYLGEVDTAEQAYVKAVPLNKHSDHPIRGLAALHSRDGAKFKALTDKLAKSHKNHPALHFYLGYNLYKTGDHAAAAKAFEVYAANGSDPAEGNFYLGLCYQKLNEPKKAHDAFLKALKANPAHDRAAFQLDAPLRQSGAEAARSVKAAQELIKGYDELLKIAPNNTLLLNNLAFTLREAYGRNQGNSAWLPILKKCRDAYVRASEIIGPCDAVARSRPFAERFGKAQIVSDTGLMFQFYPQIKDLEKAEAYYLVALEYIEDGYFDAWNNLCKMYGEQKRWQDLYDMAAVGSEKLVMETEKPHTQGRTMAEGIMKRLIQEGKAED